MAELNDLTQAMLILAGYYSPSVEQQHEYSTLMAELPQSISNRIRDWGWYFVPDFELYTDPKDLSFGRQYQIHITVKYGLHTSNPMDVVALIRDKQVEPFTVRLGQVSIFEQDTWDVVKIDVSGDDLFALNALVSSTLPVTDTYPEYKPHATIAYVKKGMGRAHIGAAEFEGYEAKIDRLTFSAKDGRHTVIPLHGVEL